MSNRDRNPNGGRTDRIGFLIVEDLAANSRGDEPTSTPAAPSAPVLKSNNEQFLLLSTNISSPTTKYPSAEARNEDARKPYNDSMRSHSNPVLSIPSLCFARANYLFPTYAISSGRDYLNRSSVELEPMEEPSLKTFAYKPVARKVRPVPSVLPEEYRIARRPHPDPLRDMPVLPTIPVPFKPTGKLTKERLEALDLDPDGFLWPQEKMLVVNLLMAQQGVFA